MAPTSVPCASSSGAHETHNDGKITRCEHGQPRRSSSQDRRSVASARPSGALASTAATTQTSASVPKSLQRCRCSPSSCSHHLPSNLPNARFVRGGEHQHGNFVRGDEAISSMKGCSLWVRLCMYRRCVVGVRPIAHDMCSTLPARRVDLRRFTRVVGRMYLLCFNASRVSHRVLTGRFYRRCRIYPSSRHGRAVTEAAGKGTRA